MFPRLTQNLKVSIKSSRFISHSTQSYIDLELAKSAHNYHPVPVVISKALGAEVWDVDGKV